MALFHWKVLFTGQFSILENWEAANQGYAWHQFAVSSLKKGILPLWDPYQASGRPHIGEMQPGLFYPLKLLLYLWPLNHSGMLSERLFLEYHVLGRFLGACFMFFLARELTLKNYFAAFVAAVCFGTGGLVGNAAGLQLLDSAIWLPLILLFLIRALRSAPREAICYAVLSGFCLGIAVLAGSIHLPIMGAIVVVTATVFFCHQFHGTIKETESRARRWLWSASVVGIVAAMASATAAIQLFPSIEYAPLAFRWQAAWFGPVQQKIPYWALTQGYYLPPRALLALLFGSFPYPGKEFNPYLGVLPLFLTITGAGVYWWRQPWVRYLCGLAVLAFFFAMGPLSLLHGVLYLVPLLDKAWEAGRFVYLVNFAMALLAAFGACALLTREDSSENFLRRLYRVLWMTTVVVLIAFTVPGLYGRPPISEWFFYSLTFLIATWGVFAYILCGNRTRSAQLALVAIILCDLYGFNWGMVNRATAQRNGQDYLEQLLAADDLAKFFRQQPGLFRVHMETEAPDTAFVNLGDMFGIQMTWGVFATSIIDRSRFPWSTAGLNLLNVRYIATIKKREQGKLAFRNEKWNVYENATPCPRAWAVSSIIVEPSVEQVLRRIQEPDFDPMRMAFVDRPLGITFPNADHQLPQEVAFSHYQDDRFELDVSVAQTSFLVLSEMYYPGWQATVNGSPTPIYRTNGLLRGIEVRPGQNHVVFNYRPRSVMFGAALTALAFGVAVLCMGLLIIKRASV